MYKYLFLSLPFLACTGGKSDMIEMDLLAQGVPIKILAPVDATVNVDDLGIIKDITITDSLNFNVQIFASDASSLNSNKIKNDQKKIVEEARFFSKIMREDDNGFIFEKKNR